MNLFDFGLTALAVGLGWIAAPFLFIILLFVLWHGLYLFAGFVDFLIKKKRKFIRWWTKKNV